MEVISRLPSLLLFLATAALLAISGLKRKPGLGVIGALMLALAALWIRGEGVTAYGFRPPQSWATTLFYGLILGLGVQVLSVAVIEPFSERLTKKSHDHSLVEGVRGSWRTLLQWLIAVWLLVAVLEEGIYRGFLMTEFARLAGLGSVAITINLLLTSIVFGLSHGYQGRSGIVSTGIIGFILGTIFVLSSFNIWLAIATHGFIDTIGLALIAVGADQAIRQRIWGRRSPGPDPDEPGSAG